MKITIRAALFILILIRTASLYATPTEASPVESVSKEILLSSYGKLPLSFEENRGQADPEVAFLSRGQGYTLFLTSSEAVLSLQKETEITDERAEKAKGSEPGKTLLKMQLVNANKKAAVSGEELLPGKSHYFVGRDPAKWKSDVPNYAKVKYRQVYPGIDLVYYGNQRQLEYDFVVAPGGDPKRIRLGFQGAEKVEISKEGDLILNLGKDAVRLHRPLVYQERDGHREVIPAHYIRQAKNQIGFQVAAYDTKRALIIDPVLSYSTFLGGSGGNAGNGIAVDASGQAYITGRTRSNDFRTTPGAFDRTFNGGYTDVFVVKLNATGSAFLYATYLGGNGNEIGNAIAIDRSGHASVTGTTSSPDFPTTPGAFNTTFNGGGPFGPTDAFVAKFDSGGALLYSTFLGGKGDDSGNGVAMDGSGNTYITGTTNSANFPTTSGAFNKTLNGGEDVFVAKLNPTGSALLYSTYVGGASSDSASKIAIDSSGSAYITGTTASSDFPATPGAFDTTYNGNQDAFVAKLNAAGSDLLYATFLGGAEQDAGMAIALDLSGNAYVAGWTVSPGFPITPVAFDTTFKGVTDAFAAKLNATGSDLLYSTFLGGSETDSAYALAVDAAGNAYITGGTVSPNFPVTRGAFDTTYNYVKNGLIFDGFLTRLNATGSAATYSTFLGGTLGDSFYGIALDSSAQIYLTGGTSSTDFPITVGGVDVSNTNRGDGDGFVLMLNLTNMDIFNRPDTTDLGPAWNEYQTDLDIFSGQVRSVNAGGKAAVYRRSVGPDQSVSAACKITANDSGCGVMARWSDGNNFYYARIDVGRQNLVLFKTVKGTTTILGSVSRNLQLGTYYRIRLVAEGPLLAVYFEDEQDPAIHAEDTSLEFGDFSGIRAWASASQSIWFDDFGLVTPYPDTFTRPNLTGLGPDWNEYLPDLEIASNQLRTTNTGNKAATFNQVIGPDQNVAVHCKVTAANNACGIMARWTDENNFYRLRLDAGQQNIILFKTVNGITTRLGIASRPIQLNVYYRLRLVVHGSDLTAFFHDESTPAFTVSDSALTKGDFAGIRSFASAPFTTWYDNFDVSPAENPFGGSAAASSHSAAKFEPSLEVASEIDPSGAAAAGGGCAMSPGGEFDPTLIAIMLAILLRLGRGKIKSVARIDANPKATVFGDDRIQ
jgi:hypothetical protein